MKELLEINEFEELDVLGIKKITINYRAKWYHKIIDWLTSKYHDKKDFNTKYWVIFKDGIIKNFYNQKRCKINFIKG